MVICKEINPYIVHANHNQDRKCLGCPTLLCSCSAESAGLDVEPLGASATEPSPLSDLEGSEADRPVPSDNAAAPGDSLVGARNRNMDYFLIG